MRKLRLKVCDSMYEKVSISHTSLLCLSNANHVSYHHFVNILFEANKSIVMKDFWEERDLESQKRYFASDGKFFQDY